MSTSGNNVWHMDIDDESGWCQLCLGIIVLPFSLPIAYIFSNPCWQIPCKLLRQKVGGGGDACTKFSLLILFDTKFLLAPAPISDLKEFKHIDFSFFFFSRICLFSGRSLVSKAGRHLALDGAPQGLHRLQIRSPAHGGHAATNGSVSHGKEGTHQNISPRNHARSDGGERPPFQ